jgi:hypothetical protein
MASGTSGISRFYRPEPPIGAGVGNPSNGEWRARADPSLEKDHKSDDLRGSRCASVRRLDGG